MSSYDLKVRVARKVAHGLVRLLKSARGSVLYLSTYKLAKASGLGRERPTIALLIRILNALRDLGLIEYFLKRSNRGLFIVRKGTLLWKAAECLCVNELYELILNILVDNSCMYVNKSLVELERCCTGECSQRQNVFLANVQDMPGEYARDNAERRS